MFTLCNFFAEKMFFSYSLENEIIGGSARFFIQREREMLYWFVKNSEISWIVGQVFCGNSSHPQSKVFFSQIRKPPNEIRFDEKCHSCNGLNHCHPSALPMRFDFYFISLILLVRWLLCSIHMRFRAISKIPLSETVIEQSSYLSCSKAIFVHINIFYIVVVVVVVFVAVWWFHSFSNVALMCGRLYKMEYIWCLFSLSEMCRTLTHWNYYRRW